MEIGREQECLLERDRRGAGAETPLACSLMLSHFWLWGLGVFCVTGTYSFPLPKIIRGRRRGRETVFGDGGQVLLWPERQQSQLPAPASCSELPRCNWNQEGFARARVPSFVRLVNSFSLGFYFSAKSNCTMNRCALLGTSLSPPCFLVFIFIKRRLDEVTSESFSCSFIP